jgi:hypothetical protein
MQQGIERWREAVCPPAHPQHGTVFGDGRLLVSCGPRHTLPWALSSAAHKKKPEESLTRPISKDAHVYSAPPSMQRVRLMRSVVIGARRKPEGAAVANSEANADMQAPVGQHGILVTVMTLRKPLRSRHAEREAVSSCDSSAFRALLFREEGGL